MGVAAANVSLTYCQCYGMRMLSWRQQTPPLPLIFPSASAADDNNVVPTGIIFTGAMILLFHRKLVPVSSPTIVAQKFYIVKEFEGKF